MRFLRQNTAVNVTVGPFIDHADGLTPLDAMTVTDVDGVISYDDDDGTVGSHFAFSGTASGGDNDLVAVGHGGLWTLEITQAQTNYIGRMLLSLWDPLQTCPVFHEFEVITATLYDTLFVAQPCTAINKFFNVASPTGTVNSLPDAVAGAANGLPVIDATGAKLTKTVDLTSGQSIAASSVPAVVLANSASHGGAASVITLLTPIAATVPNTQKVDVETIKTQAVVCAATTTVLASVGAPAAPGAAGGLPTTNGTKVNQTVDLTAGQQIDITETAIAELAQGIPSATPTIKTAIMLLYMERRNKLTTTATELGIYNDAGAKIAKATLSDDGTTFEKTELVSGA